MDFRQHTANKDIHGHHIYRTIYKRKGDGLLKKIGLKNREPCKQPEALTRVFLKDTDEEEKLGLLDHIFSCPSCSTEFPSLKEFWSAEKTVGDELDTRVFAENEDLTRRVAGKEIKRLKL